MNMKLSRRDRVIILIVAVAVIIGVGIFTFLKPKYGEVQASEDRLAAKESEKAALEAKIATLDDLKLTLKKNVEAVEKVQEQFISEKEVNETQKISQYVMSMLEPSGITINSVTLSDLGATRISEYMYNKNALAYPMKINGDIAHKLPDEVYYAYEGNYPLPGPDAVIAGTVVTVDYKCGLDSKELFDAIQIIADHEKTVYLNTCSSQTEESAKEGKEDAEDIQGQLVMTIYEVYPMDPADLDAASN